MRLGRAELSASVSAREGVASNARRNARQWTQASDIFGELLRAARETRDDQAQRAPKREPSPIKARRADISASLSAPRERRVMIDFNARLRATATSN